MIEKKNIHDVSPKTRSIYSKGVEAADKNSHDYAIDLLKTAVIMEPGFLPAREKLRSLEKKRLLLKSKKTLFKSLKIKKLVKIGQLDLVRKKYKDAYASAEEALAIDIKNLSALNLLAEVAETIEAPFIVIETYELAQELYPENPEVLRKLANAYRDNKMGAMELKIRKKLIKMFPNDLQAKSELRSASAAAILEKHDLENIDTSYVEKLKNIDEAHVLEQKERIVHNIDDVQSLINKYEDDLLNNPNSVGILRKLGELYQKGGLHSKAFEYFKRLSEVNKTFDITINRSMEKSELALIENEINDLSKTLEENPAKTTELTEKITILKQQFNNIREIYALKRVKLYPNNLLLRFSLALIFWEKKEFDSAIEQFQLSQTNLQYHIPSLLFLGRCFLCKKQFDIAIEQLKKVVDELSTMTEQKIEALYYLGIAYENINDSLNAMDSFKQVYSVQSTYKDISARVQKYYE
jgi:tetratricopeptide (TPR) repeat protein